MSLVRLRETATSLDWSRVPAGEAVPETGAVLLALADWLKRPEGWTRHDPVGVWLDSSEGPEALEADVATLPAIALHFPAFTDGRSYSSARILRERFGYTGELIATGDVLIDQVRHLVRCGFDVFEPAKGFTREDVLAVTTGRALYQVTGDGQVPAQIKRRAGALA